VDTQNAPKPESAAERPITTDALTLAATVQAPAAARAFVQKNLRAWGHADAIEEAELVMSELATNAIQRTNDTGKVIRLYMALMSKTVLVGVIDHAKGRPHVVQADDEDEHFRGLFLVEQMSVRWGCDDLKPSTRGKMVWSILAL
jgi:anti-sigma regulatory factor (Ser/Thr protein kinase)